MPSHHCTIKTHHHCACVRSTVHHWASRARQALPRKAAESVPQLLSWGSGVLHTYVQPLARPALHLHPKALVCEQVKMFDNMVMCEKNIIEVS